MNRRAFLGMAGASALAAGAGAGLTWGRSDPVKLPLLPMTDLTGGIDDRIALALRPSTHDFGNGAASETFGINNSYLGPVLRVKQGQTLPFDVTNGIGDVTTLHWHGLHIPGDVDGGPHQEIEPGQTWSPDVPIVQHASMNWFHSHTHGKTAQQTYRGLAGVMLIEDDASLSADVPRTYGVDDFTMVLQDKTFDGDGKLWYQVSAEVFEDGFEGDTLVVNGVIAPTMQTVPAGLVRFRILNACNARFLDLSLSNGAPLTVIASDGGFLPSPVETAVLNISPGERYEILVDMRGVENAALQVGFPEGEPEGFEIISRFLSGDPVMTAVDLRTDPALPVFDGAVPKALANLLPPQPEAARRTREFRLNMGEEQDLATLALAWGNFCGKGGMGINGNPMNMERIDVEVPRGEYEIWRITAEDMEHPFHIHGCSFRILRQRGAEPPAYAQGWKDMVAVQEGVSEVLVRFDHAAPANAPYMYHCHILEHEDCGMMGQFTVS